jgi:hypothetical protein
MRLLSAVTALALIAGVPASSLAMPAATHLGDGLTAPAPSSAQYRADDDDFPGRGYGWGRERRFRGEEFPGRGYGNRDRDRARVQRFWDGRCWVTRVWRDGAYRESRQCEAPRYRRDRWDN